MKAAQDPPLKNSIIRSLCDAEKVPESPMSTVGLTGGRGSLPMPNASPEHWPSDELTKPSSGLEKSSSSRLD